MWRRRERTWERRRKGRGLLVGRGRSGGGVGVSDRLGDLRHGGPYVHVVEFMFVVAPDGVVEVVAPSDKAEGFVRVVPVELLAVLALCERKAPILDIDVLMSCLLRLFKLRCSHGD